MAAEEERRAPDDPNLPGEEAAEGEPVEEGRSGFSGKGSARQGPDSDNSH